MAALENQMNSMLPSADDDIRPEDYTQYKPDDFTGRSFAADSFQETKDRFMDAGKIDVDPDDPAIFTAYKRAVDYLKDTGLAGLGLADTAFKYAVGSVAQVMPTEQLEKRIARDLYSMPEAFGGAVGAKSITQLDDAADAFLAGSKQVAQKLKVEYDPTMVRSFVGATPPTYQERETPLSFLSGESDSASDEVLDIYNMGLLMFREPVVEFAETLDIPKKGLLGSEFLNRVKKNPSIPETSLQESVIEPSRRYTKDELLRALGVNANTQGTFRSVANISPARIKQFERYQRQGKDAGFVGGTEIDYFDIPLDVTIGYPGKKFKAHSQHYQDETLVHVRGSILNSNPLPDRDLVAFDTIIDDDNFLLVEEIQSDLLTKGYVKPKSPFDAAFSEAIDEYNADNPVSYQEAYGDISTDIQKIFKELDEEGIYSPELPIQLESFNSNPFFSPETEAAFTNKISDRGYTTFEELKDYIKSQNTNSDEIWGILSRLKRKVPGVSVVNNASGGKTYTNISLDLDDPTFENFLDTFYESVKGSEIDHDILMHKYEDFIDNYNEVLLKKIKEKGLSKELDLNDLQRLREKYEGAGAKGTLSVGLPPIRKNKQAVDEALKVLIAKAAQQGVDKIVIPPAERIAMARGRELKKDKGDRFYRTYVTDLNKSLKELEDNYPVIVHRDVELPYLSKTDVQDGDPFGMMNEPDFTEIDEGAALQAAIDAGNPNAIVEASAKIFDAGNKGTILDISELIDKYKIEQPRQFAKGGVAMNEQMEMAFMQQGGLKDDGMKRDPVSGNEVPNGSMAKEVRDDIPAQLSEGEYVVPADVVRYLGVKHFEDLRDKAKSGLQSMEANGRIGGEPVPVGGPKAMQQPQQMQPPMPQAPTPYSPPPAPMPPQPRQIAMGGDLTPEEMQEINNIMMNQGGMVAGAANGADFSFYKPPEGVSVKEAITTPGRPGGGRYTGEFSFEQPPAPIAPAPSPAPAPTGETPQTCAARGMVYNPKTKMCEMPAPTPIVGGDGSSKDEDEGEDSTTWMDNYDYTDFNNLAQQTSAALDGPTSVIGGVAELLLGGGVLGKFAKASNAAQVAANIAVLKAQGQDVSALTNKFNSYIKNSDLTQFKNFITGKQLAKQINATQIDVPLGLDDTDVFGNRIFKDKDEFNKQLQDNAPAGMVYTPEQGAYIRSEGVSAAPSTSIRPEGGFAAAKAAATPVSKPATKKVSTSTVSPRPSYANPSQDPYRENRDPGPSGAEVAQAAAAAATKDRLDKSTKAEGQSGGFRGSVTSGSVYAGGNRAEGGLMLKKKKPKKKK
ncbi:hypothetical protein N9924_00505 [bacterium]|nr:hypothetical protein [bacterium]